MGFLKNLFKSSEIEILAPVSGEAVPLSEVSDPTFSQEILGKGAAIRPSANQIVAPCDAVIDMMFDTGHAVSMTSEDGVEILVHVGLETVNLKGQFFKVFAKSGDKVKAGQPLIEFDSEGIRKSGYDLITPVIVCNSDDYSAITPVTGKQVTAGEKLLSLSK